MKFVARNILLIFSLVAFSNADSSENCLGIETVEDRGYHAPDSCDLTAFNNYKGSLGKEQVQAELTATGIHNVPDETTVVCPVGESSLVEENMMKGQDTMWFVESVASAPVILSWLNRDDGLEYSAVNRKITPAQADPQAVLNPGDWKAVHAFESDIFYVRQLVGGVAGPLLLQHRVGLVPIDGENPPNERSLLSNKAHIDKRQPEMAPPGSDLVTALPAETKRSDMRRPVLADGYDWSTCNVVDIGFRNYVGKPLFGFWLESTPGLCKEHQTFHLGTNTRPTNFAFDITSNTKFEKTYMGHTYVFRTVESGELVATYTLKPTKVRDCTVPASAAKISVSGEVEDVKAGIKEDIPGVNSTELLDTLVGQVADATIPGATGGVAST